jgi:pyruvate kinase
VTPSERVFNRLILSWGIKPILSEGPCSTDELIKNSIEAAKADGYIKAGDIVVITAGTPAGEVGSTNLLKVDIVE